MPAAAPLARHGAAVDPRCPPVAHLPRVAPLRTAEPAPAEARRPSLGASATRVTRFAHALLRTAEPAPVEARRASLGAGATRVTWLAHAVDTIPAGPGFPTPVT